MPRLLIIDDDDDLRLMLRVLFQSAHYEVVDAHNGREGLRVMEQQPADLVITDLIMPEQEGIETIMALRRRYPTLRIVAISGGGHGTGINYLELARRVGANRALTKPVGNDELLQHVKELLEQPS
jgi:CheY-like chemotaxis protein